MSQRWRQSWAQPKLIVVVAHAGKAGDDCDPTSRQRPEVEPIRGVAPQVVEVHQGGLGEIGEPQCEVTELDRQDRVGAGRER